MRGLLISFWIVVFDWFVTIYVETIACSDGKIQVYFSHLIFKCALTNDPFNDVSWKYT